MLAHDLKESFPGVTGFSARNLWTVRQFFLEYVDSPRLQPLAAQIPWAQNVEIMSRVKEEEARHYYLDCTAEMGWTRVVLIHQIKGQAFERHRLVEKQHNFKKALPIHLAEQADLAMKDIYMLDFLGIRKPILERESSKEEWLIKLRKSC